MSKKKKKKRPASNLNASKSAGNHSEARVLSVIRAMVDPWVLDCRRATTQEDANGVDLVVTTHLGPILIQVKSSRSGARKWWSKESRRKASLVDTDRCESLRRELIRVDSSEVASPSSIEEVASTMSRAERDIYCVVASLPSEELRRSVEALIRVAYRRLVENVAELSRVGDRDGGGA